MAFFYTVLQLFLSQQERRFVLELEDEVVSLQIVHESGDILIYAMPWTSLYMHHTLDCILDFKRCLTFVLNSSVFQPHQSLPSKICATVIVHVNLYRNKPVSNKPLVRTAHDCETGLNIYNKHSAAASPSNS